MKRRHMLFLGLCATVIWAKDQRVWEQATLISERSTPPGPDTPARVALVQEMKIQTNGFIYTLSHNCLKFRPRPNITVNGPIKLSIQKGKFTIMDEDGREFRMSLLQKALVRP